MSPEELLDIMNYINRIIKHIADGNEYEERMVSIMGGTVEETPSQKLKRLEDEKNKIYNSNLPVEVKKQNWFQKIIIFVRQHLIYK